MNTSATELERRLRQELSRHPALLVAYSGGVDSALLADCAARWVPSSLAVIADSPSLARSEFDAALDFARARNFSVEVVHTSELDIPEYRANSGDRCYYCKRTLFEKLSEVNRSLEGKSSGWKICYGLNTDDLGDYRPGIRAAREAGVYTPYVEIGFGKAEIRVLARHLGLNLADKPAQPCLASRIPHGDPVDRAKLEQVEKAEDILRRHGFKVVRVRHHRDVARVEVAQEDLARLIGVREDVCSKIRALGFHHVALDLEGFKSGSLNRSLSAH